jgi:hypothetical protein
MAITAVQEDAAILARVKAIGVIAIGSDHDPGLEPRDGLRPSTS